MPTPPWFKPTPTPLPAPPIAPVLINARAWRIWSYTDEALMIWHQMGPTKTQVIQIAVLLVIFIAFATLGIRWIKTITNQIGDI